MRKNSVLLMCFFYTWITQTYAQSQLLPIRVQGKWGCIDATGKIVIEPAFEYIGTFKDEQAIAQRNGRLGVIDKKGKTLLPFEHFSLDTLTKTCFAVRNEQGKWGAIKITGEIIVPVLYEEIQALKKSRDAEPILLVKQADKYGAFNTKGKEISTCAYDSFEFYTQTLIIRKQKDKIGVIRIDGKEALPTEYDEIAVFPAVTGHLLMKKHKQLGVLNSDGEIVLPCEYDQIKVMPYSDKNGIREQLIEIHKQSKKGLLDYKLKEIIPVMYDDIENVGNGFFAVMNNQLYGLYEQKTKSLVIACEYKQILPLTNSLALVRKYQGTEVVTGIYNFEKQKVVIPIEYARVLPLQGGGTYYFLTTQLKYYTFYDINGRIIAKDSDFDDVYFDAAGTFITRKGNLYGILGSLGIIKPTFSVISRFKNNIALVKKDDKIGLINIRGQIIAETHYTSVTMRGKTAHFLLPNGSTDVMVFDNEGNVVSKNNYAKLRTIHIKKGKQVEEKVEEWAFDFTRSTSVNNINNLISGNQLNRRLGIPTRSLETFNAGVLTWVYYTQKKLWTALKGADTLIKPTFLYINEIPNLQLTQTFHIAEVKTADGKKDKPHWGLLDNTTGKWTLEPVIDGLEQTKAIIKDLDKGVLARTPAYYIERNGKMLNAIKYEEKKKKITNILFYCEPFDTLSNTSKFNVEGYLEVREVGLKDINIKGGKWGLMHRNGTMITPPIYKSIKQSYQLNFVKTEKGIGVLDSAGQSIIPCEYAQIEYLTIQNNKKKEVVKDFLVLAKNVPRYGYLDSTRMMNINAIYKNAKHFQNGFAPVMKDTLVEETIHNRKYKIKKEVWTFINQQGQTIHPFIFKEVKHFADGLAAIKLGAKWGYLDTQGNIVIAPNFSVAQDFVAGKAVVRYYNTGKIGYIDRQGNPIGNQYFEKANDFAGKVAIAKDTTHHLYGLINEQCEWIMTPRYFAIYPFKNNYALYQKEAGNTYGLLNKEGKELTKAIYTQIENFIDGYAKVAKGADWNLIDTTGKVILTQDCKKIYHFNGNYALAKTEEGFGYINRQGVWQIKPQFERASAFEKGIAKVKKITDNKSYFIDTLANIVEKPADWYDLNDLIPYLPDSTQRYMRVQRNGLWGYWDTTLEKMFIYPNYKKATAFYNGYAKIEDIRNNIRYISKNKTTLTQLPNEVHWLDIDNDKFKTVRKNGLYGFTTIYDFVYNEPKFTYLGELKENKLLVALNMMYGIADRQGNILLEPIYERISYVGNDIFKVELNDNIGYWHKTSGWIWNISK